MRNVCSVYTTVLSHSKLFFARTHEWMYIFCLANYIKMWWCYCQLSLAGFTWCLRFFPVLSPRTLFAFFGIDNDFTHTHTHERVFTPLRQFCFCFYETRKYRFPEISCQKHFEAILVWPYLQKLWISPQKPVLWTLLLWRSVFIYF